MSVTELQTVQFFPAPLLHLRTSFRAQCVQLPLRTQDRFVALETGSEDTTLSMQCYQGLRPVNFLVTLVAMTTVSQLL